MQKITKELFPMEQLINHIKNLYLTSLISHECKCLKQNTTTTETNGRKHYSFQPSFYSFFTFFTDVGNEANTNCYLIAFIRAE